MSLDEPFPDPNTECVYISQGNLIYLGNNRINVSKLPDTESDYSLHPFLQDHPLILDRYLTNAYIFNLENKSLTSIFPEGDESNRILTYQEGFIYTWNLSENRGYFYNYRNREPIISPVQYPLGYEGKYTKILFPIGGEGEILYINNLNSTLHYKGRDLDMPSYERFDDIYYQWKPPYLLIGTEYTIFQYKLDPLREDSKLETYALPSLEAPGYISGSDDRGFITTDGDTYTLTITEDGVEMVRVPAILDGNDSNRYPELSPAMDTFLWSLDAEPIVYTHRKLREMIRNNPTLSGNVAGLIAMYV